MFLRRAKKVSRQCRPCDGTASVFDHFDVGPLAEQSAELRLGKAVLEDKRIVFPDEWDRDHDAPVWSENA